MIVRRNPRLAWIARNRLHRDHHALNNTKRTGPSGVLRKHPHHVGYIGPNGLKRIDRVSHYSISVKPVQKAKEQYQAPLPLIVVEDPAEYIGVVLDAPEGKLSNHDKDVLGLAHQIKQGKKANIDTTENQNIAVVAIAFHHETPSTLFYESLQLAGADRLIEIVCADTSSYTPELHAEHLYQIAKRLGFIHLCFPETPLMGADLGRRVAAKLHVRPATGVWKYKDEQLVCRGAADKTDITRPLSTVIIALEQCAEPIDEQRHQCLIIEENSTISVTPKITDLGNAKVNPNDISLSEANFILSGGNGIDNWNNFHKAAHLLGATEGASRVAVDNGFMPRARQVGATGTWVSAKVYIAVGISGAIQHMQGIGQCEKIVAINTDDSCDMVKRADLSVIVDSDVILNALIDTLENPPESHRVPHSPHSIPHAISVDKGYSKGTAA